MLQLGDVLIPAAEVVSFTRRGDRLRLVLRWPLEDLPVLFDLPEEVRLTWHADDDPRAGILVKSVGLYYRRVRGVERGNVSVLLERGNTVVNLQEARLQSV